MKYPRTYHVPASPGTTSDDRVLDGLSMFHGKEVVVTVKLDGENTTIYSDGYVHARSLDSGGHPSRSWVANLAARLAPELPAGWRLCGENMYAVHSIRYEGLDSYFYGFSLWDERSLCLDWGSTLEWFALLDVPSVPVLYRGLFDPKVLASLPSGSYEGNELEGWVIRTTDGFEYQQFRARVAKWVRPDHVRTAKHWFSGQRVERNKLASS